MLQRTRGGDKVISHALTPLMMRFEHGKRITIALLLLFGACTFDSTDSSVETIRIGFIGPLSGDAAVFGIAGKNSLELAVEKLHARADEQNFVVFYEDGKCTGVDAAVAAQKLVNINKVQAIFTTCSAETLATAPITEASNVLLFTYGTNPGISDAGNLVFRLGYSDTDMGRVAAKTMRAETDVVGVIYEMTDFPVGLKEVIHSEFTRLNGTIIEEGFEQGSHDVRSQITKLFTHEVGAIFLNPDTPATGLAALRQLQELGYEGPVFGNYFGGSDAVLKAPEAQGLVFFAESDVEESSAKKEFLQSYKVRYGDRPAFEYYASAQYDAFNVFAEAVGEVGNDNKKIAEYLYETRFTGLLGTYWFGAEGDAVGTLPAVKQIVNGRAITWTNNETIDLDHSEKLAG